ncbi:GNAT family N-acetyltransferase [Gilvimarinus sp. F26214L]|uniref:GNAT family N-acetyltransferase n=1 Tax=Gilvimarinus sp. DZF01 TaxID=3461371 RepID=UPI0040463DEB
MSPTLHYRRATNQDVATLRHIIYPTLKEYGLEPDPDSTDADVEDVEGHYGGPGGYFCILEADGQPIATGGIRPMTANRCELRKMYMLKEARGKGYGKQLLRHLLEEAGRMGYKEVMLETASVLTEAIALYRAFGFRDANDLLETARCDQAMVLSLENER